MEESDTGRDDPFKDEGQGVGPVKMLDQGTVVGGFKIRSPLHIGAAGWVYDAVNMATSRRVVLRILHEHLTRDAETIDAFEAALKRVGFELE